MLKQLSINVPLVEALEQMSGYAMFMKDLVTKKKSVTFKDDDRLQHYSAIAKDPMYRRKKILVHSLFLVQLGHYILRKHYVIWGKHKSHALSIYKKMGLGDPKPTAIQLLKADGTMKKTYRDTPRCASKSGVVHISSRFCYS